MPKRQRPKQPQQQQQPQQPRRSKRRAKPKPDEFVEYVGRLCQYFRSAVFAGEYEMKVDFDVQMEEKAAGKPLATICIDTTYLSLHVKVATTLRELFDLGRDKEVASTVCHEFCHVLTEPLYDLAIRDAAPSQLKEIEEVRERQTERVSMSLFALVPKEVWER